MPTDLVSIIMPSYNSEAYVAASIQSVQSQTYPHWELFVIDDASSDQTVDVVARMAAEDPRIHLIQLRENAGAAEARNHGIRAARGRYIAFLDSDDQWLPPKLARQIEMMRKKGWPLSYTAYNKIDESGLPLGHVGVPLTTTYHELLKTCVIGCLTAVYDTSILGKVEMPLIRKRQDFGLWLRLLKKTPRAYGLQETLAVYRVRADSISAKKSSAAQYTWRLYRDVEGLGLTQSLWYFGHYAARGLLRHKMPRLARALGVLQ